MTSGQLDAAYAAAADVVLGASGLLVTTHENPDGDALGSLVACSRALCEAGHDAYAYAAPGGDLPREYRWLGVAEIRRELPDDLEGRTVLALDCGSVRRIGGAGTVLEAISPLVNVDHHHDNTRFGTVNVVDASAACTTMMVRELLDRLEIPISPIVADALYVGLVTDTGRFQYSNTDARALRFAADLVELGVRPNDVFLRVYENVPAAKARLLGRALGRIDARLGGRLVLTWLVRDDFDSIGAEDSFAEGVIDHLRAIAGVEVAALAKQPADPYGPSYKVSLRSATGAVDVSKIARAAGGGGHPQAAGFSSDLDLTELAAFVEREVAASG